MLKVFLVEDETIIREGLRDIIPWQQYGYQFVGEAGDGEQALPLIREQQPDVLITDIRMPFMDGLALSNLVSREFPNMKIIIISGYDDFEYARTALRIGVEQYLLKPITKTMLMKALSEVAEKIAGEREQESYIERFRSEVQEYEQISRRRFFEEIVTGKLSVEEIYEKATRQGISLDAKKYNLLLYSIEDRQAHEAGNGGYGMQQESASQEAHDGLAKFFLMHPEYLLFRWNLRTWAVLVKAREEEMEALTERCLNTIRMHVLSNEAKLEWHVAISEPTARLSGLPHCFDVASRIYSCRHLLGTVPVLTRENTRSLIENDEESKLKNVNMAQLDPAILNGFLDQGQPEEVEDFVDEYLGRMNEAARSRLFGQYLMLNVRFTAIAYLEALGYEQQEFTDELPSVQPASMGVSLEELKAHIRSILSLVLAYREKQTKSQSRNAILQALAYIDQRFADENISLKEVAGFVGISANYFSAIFSQEMQQTFVEYLTQKRMERAKELLRGTDKKASEIAAIVGYKDPHYFSFVFRKTQGCTPREYKTRG